MYSYRRNAHNRSRYPSVYEYRPTYTLKWGVCDSRKGGGVGSSIRQVRENFQTDKPKKNLWGGG